MNLRTTLRSTAEPVRLTIEGVAEIQGTVTVRQAVPAEDRMQAFLWQHLVPAQDLVAMVYNPADEPPPTRVPDPKAGQERIAEARAQKEPSQFTRRQVAGRLRQLNGLYQEWLLTDEFYNVKVAECEAAREN